MRVVVSASKMVITIEKALVHIYLEVYPTVVNGAAFPQVSVDRIAA